MVEKKLKLFFFGGGVGWYDSFPQLSCLWFQKNKSNNFSLMFQCMLSYLTKWKNISYVFYYGNGRIINEEHTLVSSKFKKKLRRFYPSWREQWLFINVFRKYSRFKHFLLKLKSKTIWFKLNRLCLSNMTLKNTFFFETEKTP